MEKLSAKDFAKRWFTGSLWTFPLMSAVLSCLGAVSGSYFAAYPSSQGSCMAVLLFCFSFIFLLLGVIIGIFTAPYYISREDNAVEETRRMVDGIQESLRELNGLCNAITRGKDEKDVPLKSHRDLLENTHDSMRDSIMKNLKSLLPPDGNKDV